MKLVNSSLAALRAVRVNKLRSVLTMLGIVLGVSSVTVMMAVGGGASQRIQTEMRNLGANTIVLNSGALKSGGVSRGQGSRPSVTLADAQAIENEVPAVVAASPQHNHQKELFGEASPPQTLPERDFATAMRLQPRRLTISNSNDNI